MSDTPKTDRLPPSPVRSFHRSRSRRCSLSSWRRSRSPSSRCGCPSKQWPPALWPLRDVTSRRRWCHERRAPPYCSSQWRRPCPPWRQWSPVPHCPKNHPLHCSLRSSRRCSVDTFIGRHGIREPLREIYFCTLCEARLRRGSR